MRLGRRAAELQWRSASGVAEVLMTKEVCALVFDHHASYRHKELFPNHLVPVDIVKLYTERLRAQSGAAEKVTTTRHLSPPVDCHHLLPITTCHLSPLVTCHHSSPITTCHHSPPVTTRHLSPPVTCHHSPPVTTRHLSPADTCHHCMPPVATRHLSPPVTYHHPPPVSPLVTCHHMSPVITCHHSPPARSTRRWRRQRRSRSRQTRHGGCRSPSSAPWPRTAHATTSATRSLRRLATWGLLLLPFPPRHRSRAALPLVRLPRRLPLRRRQRSRRAALLVRPPRCRR